MKTQTQKNVIVVGRFLKQIESWDVDSRSDVICRLDAIVNELEEIFPDDITEYNAIFAEKLDLFLDCLAAEDAFGTEQECDPRGDFRDREWSMWDIHLFTYE